MAIINYDTVKRLFKEQTGYTLGSLKVNQNPITTELTYIFRNKYYRQHVNSESEESIVSQVKRNLLAHGGKFKK